MLRSMSRARACCARCARRASRVTPALLVVLIVGAMLAGSGAIAPRPAAALPVARAGRADLLGIGGNIYPWEPRWNELQQVLRDSNAGWARVELQWGYINPQPNEWNWGLLDNLVDGYRANDLQLLGLLDYSVEWASGGSGRGHVFGPPSDMDAWERYVRETATHFKGRVHAYEIWNEPDVAYFWNGQDGGDPDVYFEMLRRAHRAIKSVDPNAVVMNGGVTGTERGANFLHRLFDLGGAQYLDRVAIHGYVSPDGLETRVYPEIIWPLIDRVRERAGKPLWITEWGWSSGCVDGASACSEANQANMIARHLAMLFRLQKVEKVFYFVVKDPSDRPDWYGLVRADGSHKPAFTAWRTIAARLAGLEFAGEQRLGGGLWDMRFTGSGRTVDILWSLAGERDHAFGTARERVRAWDIRGGQRELTTSNGGVTLRLTQEPIIIERDGHPGGAGGERCRYFPETRQSLCNQFLDFWERHGGLMRFGYPLSAELREPRREGGTPLTVQYLERMKFEYHPEAAGTEWAVMGELMGRVITEGREQEAPFRPVTNPRPPAGGLAFPETGHTLAGGFRGYWEANGGLWMFGYPISEEFSEQNPDTGQWYTVQYFERARFEWHPENAGTVYEVLLGRLGAQLLDERY